MNPDTPPAHRETSRIRKRGHIKVLHREMLIEATLATIAAHGISGCSVSQILSRTSLSRGMINLHFKSKELLLTECLKQINDQYYHHWFAHLAQTAATPAGRLAAMVEADLSTNTLNPHTMAIWFAFKGEGKTGKLYAHYTDSREKQQKSLYLDACARVVEAEGRSTEVQVDDISYGLISMLDGFWQDFHRRERRFCRHAALRTCFTYLSGLFPEQFNRTGARSVLKPRSTAGPTGALVHSL